MIMYRSREDVQTMVLAFESTESPDDVILQRNNRGKTDYTMPSIGIYFFNVRANIQRRILE